MPLCPPYPLLWRDVGVSPCPCEDRGRPASYRDLFVPPLRRSFDMKLRLKDMRRGGLKDGDDNVSSVTLMMDANAELRLSYDALDHESRESYEERLLRERDLV